MPPLTRLMLANTRLPGVGAPGSRIPPFGWMLPVATKLPTPAGGPGKQLTRVYEVRVPHPTFFWLGGDFDFQVEQESVARL